MEKRMDRISKIDSFISKVTQGNIMVTSESISEELGISIATIKRDIEYMRDELNAPIKYDLDKKTYYYTEKDFKLSITFYIVAIY